MASSYNELFGLGPHSPDANLEGWWPCMDNAADTTVTDHSGKGRNITLSVNTSTRAATGPNGWLTSVFNFTGAQDGETTNSTLIGLPQTHSMTVLCRTNPAAFLPNVAAWGFRGTDDLLLYPNSQDQGTRVFWRNLGSNIIYENTGANLIGQQLDLSFTANSNVMRRARRNGALVGASIVNGSEAGPFNGFVIGNFKDSPQYYLGTLGDVSIFSRPLTDAEIDTEWRNGPEPVCISSPVASGSANIGDAISCTTGTWGIDSPFSAGSNGTITYTYQWTRSSDDAGSDEENISGATSSTYTLAPADAGKFIRCWARATNNGGYDSDADTASNWLEIASGGNRRRRMLICGAR